MKSINFRENNHVVINDNILRFRNEMGRYQPLSNDELRQTIVEAQKGSQNARKKAINANLRLVWSIAASYGNIDKFEDILQNGNIGLCIAVDTFDVSRGTMFSTWALECIRKYINIGLSNESRTVRLGFHQIKENYSVDSMDAPLTNKSSGCEESKCLIDTFASDSDTDTFSETEDMKAKIAYLMDGLKPIEKAVICGLFGLNGTEVSQYTLAKKYSLSEERIRQIKVGALEKMKKLG